MKNIILNLSSGWEFKKQNSDEFLPAEVPGCIHLDLLRNKLIPDPFFGVNEKELQWISRKNWIYRLKFFVDKSLNLKRYKRITFFGIDTFASIFLNGKKVIEANNMFHPWESDLSNNLKLGENIIEIEFRSPLIEISPKLKKLDYILPADNDKAGGMSPYIRKAPYHFGWDWGPCFVTSGLWKKVQLIGYDSFLVNSINLNQLRINNKFGEIEIEVEIISNNLSKATLFIMEESLKFEKEFILNIKKDINIFKKSFKVVSPKLWWPVGHGDQNLYNFNIRIKSNDFDSSFNKRIGFRTVKVVRKRDKKGESFTFNINNTAIFSKGANWIPADSFTTRLKKEDYLEYLKSVVEANMNTLRVWGGGIYEPDYFYELCDELGILVWQDFMFACSLYPSDKPFLKSVKKEAIYQIKRLKDHPSIVMWCGNNEIAWAWYNWEWKEKLPNHLWKSYKLLFHKVLLKVCKKYDSSRLYWPSSPGHGIDVPKTGQIYGSGDNHYWGVWHGGDDFEAYEANVGRFMSEYGMQSYPELSTIKTFAASKERNINSVTMKFHQKASLGNKNVIKYIKKYYSKPNNFESLLVISQLMQAEAIKIAVESHRRNMPYCMGSLYWQLNDCWPGASWSSIDYNKNWKALHYAAKKFFTPILVSIKQKEKYLEIFAINDLNELIDCDLVIDLFDLNGKKIQSYCKSLKLSPISAKKYFSTKVQNFIKGKNRSKILLKSFIKHKDTVLSMNNYYFVKPKDLCYPEPKFNIKHEVLEDTFLIIILPITFLYKVHFICTNCKGVFSDNYIDLLPGEEKRIKFKPVENINIKNLLFNVNTMYDLV